MGCICRWWDCNKRRLKIERVFNSGCRHVIGCLVRGRQRLAPLHPGKHNYINDSPRRLGFNYEECHSGPTSHMGSGSGVGVIQNLVVLRGSTGHRMLPRGERDDIHLCPRFIMCPLHPVHVVPRHTRDSDSPTILCFPFFSFLFFLFLFNNLLSFFFYCQFSYFKITFFRRILLLGF